MGGPQSPIPSDKTWPKSLREPISQLGFETLSTAAAVEQTPIFIKPVWQELPTASSVSKELQLPKDVDQKFFLRDPCGWRKRVLEDHGVGVEAKRRKCEESEQGIM